jgi:hypothetical protein
MSSSLPGPAIALNGYPVALGQDSKEGPGIPDDYQFEIYRLRRRVAELECAIHDRDDRIRRSLASLEDELLFWRTFLHDKVGETVGQIQRRVIRLESTLAFIKNPQPLIYPKLERRFP